MGLDGRMLNEIAGWSLWSWHFQLQSVAMAALGVGRGCYEVQVHHAQGIAGAQVIILRMNWLKSSR